MAALITTAANVATATVTTTSTTATTTTDTRRNPLPLLPLPRRGHQGSCPTPNHTHDPGMVRRNCLRSNPNLSTASTTAAAINATSSTFSVLAGPQQDPAFHVLSWHGSTEVGSRTPSRKIITYLPWRVEGARVSEGQLRTFWVANLLLGTLDPSESSRAMDAVFDEPCTRWS